MRLTKNEKERLEATAKHHNMSVSDLVRAALGLAVLALVLVGCAYEAPLPRNPQVDAPASAGAAEELVVDTWEALLRFDGNTPTILWFSDGCLEYDEPDDRCLLGRFYAHPNEIHLYRPLTDLPSNSAMTHEFLHWALDQKYGDADGEHESAWWSRTDAIILALRSEGL